MSSNPMTSALSSINHIMPVIPIIGSPFLTYRSITSCLSRNRDYPSVHAHAAGKIEISRPLWGQVDDRFACFRQDFPDAQTRDDEPTRAAVTVGGQQAQTDRLPLSGH